MIYHHLKVKATDSKQEKGDKHEDIDVVKAFKNKAGADLSTRWDKMTGSAADIFLLSIFLDLRAKTLPL